MKVEKSRKTSTSQEDSDDYYEKFCICFMKILMSGSNGEGNEKVTADIKAFISKYPNEFVSDRIKEEVIKERWEQHLTEKLDTATKNSKRGKFEFIADPGAWKNFKDEFEKQTVNSNAQQIYKAVFKVTEDFYKGYKVFSCYYNLTHEKRDELEKLVTAAKQSAETAEKTAAETAKNAIERIAEKTVTNTSKKAEEAAQAAVSQVRPAVTREASKIATNVALTCIGVISGILLIINADLIFSSSVLNNINAANPYRLILISLLCGFVCFNMVGLLLLFFRKHSIDDDSKWYNYFSTWFVFAIDFVLILGIILCCVGWNYGWIEQRTYCVPTEAATEIYAETDSDNDVNIKMDVNIIGDNSKMSDTSLTTEAYITESTSTESEP